ncbi:hypothetical protein LJR009_006123 [Bosea sp. LjRoot9]|uniref:hypothetical protein n=1 Tax=Bosea sp. LjRoot9 TaxID=3342341 RepID=UPI003ECC3709
MHVRLVLLACLLGSGAAAEEDKARRELLPTVRAATDCVSRSLIQEKVTASANDDAIRNGARRAFGLQCQAEGRKLVLEHDRLHGVGTGRGFVDGPYFADLPRAVRVRMANTYAGTMPSAKPRRCPDMLEIYEVQDSGRTLAQAEQAGLQRQTKTEMEVLASFTQRMEQRLQQARHAMARPVLEEFRALPASDMGICFPAIVPVMAEARAIAEQIELRRQEAERQQAESERQRYEEAQRRAEAERIAEVRRAETQRIEEERRAEAQRIAEERRQEARAAAERARLAAEKAAEEERLEALRPINVLKTAYQYYAFVKKCNEFRDGYVSIFISENEIVRARTAIKAIETKIKILEPSINTDMAWSTATGGTLNVVPERAMCQGSLQSLIAMFEKLAPDAAAPKKDF